MHKKTLRWLSALSMTGVMLFSLSGCQLLPEEEAFPTSPVVKDYETQEYKQTLVMRGDMALTENVRCQYMPTKSERYSFLLGGEFIDRVQIVKGQHVKAGDVLMALVQNNLTDQIKTQEYQIQVLNTKLKHIRANRTIELKKIDAQIAEAETKLQQVRALKEQLTAWENQNNASAPRPTQLTMQELQQEERTLSARKETLTKSKSTVTESYKQQEQELSDTLYIENLRLDEKRDELKKRQLVAGIDGTITYLRVVKDGDRSVEGQAMVTVADMSSSAFTVKGDATAYFPVGAQVEVTHKDKLLPAVVVEASELGLSAPKEGEEPVAYVRLLQTEPTLEDGDYATIVVTHEFRENVLYVDKDAVKSADGRKFVYILNEEGLKVMHDVETGLEAKGNVEIVSGLKEGDSVILD